MCSATTKINLCIHITAILVTVYALYLDIYVCEYSRGKSSSLIHVSIALNVGTKCSNKALCTMEDNEQTYTALLLWRTYSYTLYRIFLHHATIFCFVLLQNASMFLCSTSTCCKSPELHSKRKAKRFIFKHKFQVKMIDSRRTESLQYCKLSSDFDWELLLIQRHCNTDWVELSNCTNSSVPCRSLLYTMTFLTLGTRLCRSLSEETESLGKNTKLFLQPLLLADESNTMLWMNSMSM